MKKIFPVVVLCIISLSVFGQDKKTKNFDIGEHAGVNLGGMITFIDNVPTDTLFYMFGRDARYNSLVEIFTIRSGTLEDIETLLKKLSESFTEDDGTSLKFGPNRVHVTSVTGTRALWVYSEDGDRAYIRLTKNQLLKVIAKVDTYKAKGKK